MKAKQLLSLAIAAAMTISTFTGLATTSASAAVGDAANNIWTASEWTGEMAADTVLYDGDKGTLATLFEMTKSETMENIDGVDTPTSVTIGNRTFTHYMSHPDMNGGFRDDGTLKSIENGDSKDCLTLFSFVPKADGVVTVYFQSVGSTKKACIVENGALNYKSGGSLVFDVGTGNMAVSAELEANKTYYMFVDGSKGRFMAVDYEVGATYEKATPAPATPKPTYNPEALSWAASELSMGVAQNAVLMKGLTTMFADTANNKVYISSGSDFDEEAQTGTALKFVAFANGYLTATIKDITGAESAKGAYIKESTAEKGVYVASKILANGDPKQDVTITAAVEAGKTYYIAGKGTKARFAAVSYSADAPAVATNTPATNTPATNAPATGKPVAEKTPAPLNDGITYYANGSVAVKAANVTSGVLIKAAFNGKKLVGVNKAADLTFANGVANATIAPVAAGTKLMAWDSLGGMKALCSSYTVTGNEGNPSGPADPTNKPSVTPAATPASTPSTNLPADILWRADDPAFAGTLAGTGATIKGLTVPSGLGDKGKKVKYTHTDGKEYTFTSQWSGFSSTPFTFTPEQACIVTVIVNGNGSANKSLIIKQGETQLISQPLTITSNSAAEVVTADVEDPTKGEISITGGGGGKNLSAIFVEYYDPTVLVTRKLSGHISYTGTLGMADKTLVFTSTKTGEKFEMPYAADYSIDLPQNAGYTISVKNQEENICVSLDTKEVYIAKEDKTHNIDVADIVDSAVKGEIVTHGLDLTNVTITFTAKDDPTITKNATITAAANPEIPTATNNLSVVLTPNHEYTVTAAGIDGYTLSPLSSTYMMEAGDSAPFKNILFTKNVAPIAFKDTLTVGTGKDYATIQEAVNAVSTMTDRPAGEAGRVAIVVDAGTYTEQLQINAPFVTLKAADPANRPKITFYYGIGYLYYSAASNGYYSEDSYVQRTKLGSANRWGCTVRVTGANFLAENIIFENSLSCYVTPEEKVDGVTPAVPGSPQYSDGGGYCPDRTAEGFDPKAKTAVERAAAFAGDASNFELYNCDFISSQDTLYTGNNGYLKNCYIEGGTDYVFGGNSVVFDDCTLAWHGYSDQVVGGYISACKTSASWSDGISITSNGYLFKDCTVANSKYYPNNKFDKGSWGRNWGGKDCRVIFLNTTLDGVDMPGTWVKMGGELNTSQLIISGVKKNDAVVDVSGSGYQFNETGFDADKVEPTDYFDDWEPVHYDGVIPEKTTYKTVWQFGKSNGAESYALEGADQTAEISAVSNDGTARVLTVDATNGKFNNSTRTDNLAQVNDGTRFIVPVANGSIISFSSHNANGKLTAAGLEIENGKEFTYHGNASTLTLTAEGCGYMSHIAVETPINPEDYVEVKKNVTIAANIENGTVTTDAQEGQAVVGNLVTITATPNNGYSLKTITVTTAGGSSVTVKDGKFIMPNDDVTITATFEAQTTVNGTITGLDDADKSAVEIVGKLDNVFVAIPVTDGAFTTDLENGKTFNVIGIYNGASAYTIADNTTLTAAQPAPVIAAAKVVAAPALGTTTYNFTNGSVVPQYLNEGELRHEYNSFVTPDGLLTFTNMTYWNDHGLSGTMGLKIKVPAGKTTVTFKGCQYSGNGKVTAVTAGIAPNETTLASSACGGDVTSLVYTGAATELEFTGTGGYIYGLTVVSEAAEIGPDPTPVTTPVATPIATPVATPIATPVATPIATPVATPIATPLATPTVEPTMPPTKWAVINSAEGYKLSVVKEGEDYVDVLTLEAGKGTDKGGFSYDLTKVEGFSLPSSYSSAEGLLTVSFDLFVNSAKTPSNNYFIDLAMNNDKVDTWHGYNNPKVFGRFGGYSANNEVSYIASGKSTSTSNAYELYKNNNGLVKDAWKTVTFTVDLKTKSAFTGEYGEDGKHTVLAYPASNNIVDGKLYLNIGYNVAPAGHDVEMKVKNINASYTTENVATYNVTKGAINGGDVTFSSTAPRVGETVTITAAPTAAEGVFTELAVENGLKLTKVDNTHYTFVMPASDVTVTATMAAHKMITVVKPSKPLDNAKAGGTFECATSAAPGSTVKITATPFAGHKVVSYSVTDTDDQAIAGLTVSADGEFTMPDQNIKVSVIFGAADNTKVIYFADATAVSGTAAKIQEDKGLSVMNYVKNGGTATWPAQSLKLGNKAPTSMKVVATKSNDPQASLSLDNTTYSTATTLPYDENTKFDILGATYYVNDVSGALANVSFTDSDTLYFKATSASGNTGGYIGNYWYIILEYAE